MHISAPQVESAVRIPLLHIADATGERIVTQKLRRVGLLGTAFTMEMGFYKDRLRDRFGLDIIVPDSAERGLVQDIIFNELVSGVIKPESKAILRDAIASLAHRGAQGVILGCTELMLIVDQSDSAVALFDTTTIHCEAAVELALIRTMIRATIAAIGNTGGD